MDKKKVAIACQGGGIHGAFTCGVLTEILQAKEADKNDQLPADAKRRFDICALSGTSAGALNAFMVWYDLMPKKGADGSCAEAREAVNGLWDVFQANKSGERAINQLMQIMFRLESVGLSVKHPNPPKNYDRMMTALKQWSKIERRLCPDVDFGEIRSEFYDFTSLLMHCAPHFEDISIKKVARKRTTPRLLIGAVEILSGEFEVFDSFMIKEKPDGDLRTDEQAQRPISYGAVEASGTLPDIRRAQRIPGLKNIDNVDPLYWDGLFSQNPPIRELMTGLKNDDLELIPDEIWVIRINPQKRKFEPESLSDIEDRRNELAGNQSLNQELKFISKVNEWIERYSDDFGNEKKPIAIHMITMSEEWSDKLKFDSKFNRSPAFVKSLREHGRARGAAFLENWYTRTYEDPEAFKWPRETPEIFNLSGIEQRPN